MRSLREENGKKKTGSSGVIDVFVFVLVPVFVFVLGLLFVFVFLWRKC